jgi:hypothetical protein
VAPIRDVVIELDANDDYASTRSRLAAAGARNVAVVIGPRCRRLRSVVAMRVLRADADDLGLDLTVVSRDGAVRQLARDLGLRAFPSVGALARHRRVERALERLPAPLGWLARGVGALATMAVALALIVVAFALPFYLLVPQMVVRISPQAEEIVERLELRADPLTRQPSSATRQIPARVVEVEVEGTERFEATGRREAPGAAAQGVVTLANRGREPVRVPQGTILVSTTGARYVTTREVEVPGGLLATAQVPVVALQPGPAGNAQPLQINRIEGELAGRLAVTNERPLVGGGTREAAIVTPEDIERARQALFARLERQAANDLLARRREGEIVPPEAIRASLVDQQFDRQIGDEADTFIARLRVRAVGTAFATQDVATVLVEVLRQRGTPLALTSPTFRTKPPHVLRLDGQTVVFAIEVSGSVQKPVDVRDIEHRLRGLTAEAAHAYLASHLKLARAPSVEIRPEWASRALRVHVIIEPAPHVDSR